MIYNRTASDVEEAIRLRAEKVQQFLGLTEKEFDTLERGMLTIITLNRIEAKQEELKGLINDMGYWDTDITNRAWGYEDVFGEADFKRILKNSEILKKAFYVFLDTPAVPNPTYNYKTFNAIEKILVDIEEMILDMKSRYRKSGTFKSGEENIQ